MSSKRKSVMCIGILAMIGVLAGCGKMADEVQNDDEARYTPVAVDSGEEHDADTDAENAENEIQADSDKSGEIFDVAENTGTGEMISDEEAASLNYMEKVMIEDFYGDMTEYEMYAPIGSDNEDGYLWYIDHGLMFSAMVYNDGSQEFLYEGLDISLELQKEELEKDFGLSDIQASEIIENGDDRYVFLSARGEDHNGSVYDRNMVIYLDVREGGVGIQWELEITEFSKDSETDLIVDEIAKCYGVNLAALAVSGDWAQEDAQWAMERQDVYEPKEGEPELSQIDGYQYLGTVMLSLDDGAFECPIMLPMGWNTSVKGEHASASMHGIYVYIQGYKTVSKNYLAGVEDNAERSYRLAAEPEEGNKNVKRSEVMTMDGFGEAVYYVIEYDELDYKGEEYHRQANVHCYIGMEGGYHLGCDIWLSSEAYDEATNILLKELETAYGLDLSGYYYEKED